MCLSWFSLTAVRLPQKSIEHLASCEKLSYLKLEGEFVDDLLASSLQRLGRLDELELNATRLTDDGLGCLLRLQNLVRLTIQVSDITGEGLADIRKLTSLRNLTLAHSRITASSIRRAIWPKGLQYLGLDANPITLKALTAMHLPSGLRSLSVVGIVSDEGDARRLKARRPSLHIFWGADSLWGRAAPWTESVTRHAAIRLRTRPARL